jgi:hypothetical protein
MAARVLISAAADELTPLTAFNQPVFRAHDELIACVVQRLGLRAAGVFARPSVVGTEIAWSTDAPGEIVPAGRLQKAERPVFQDECVRFGEALAALVTELGKAGVNTRSGNLAEILKAALAVPGPEFLFAVGGLPVLTFWGFTGPGGASLNVLSAARTALPAMVRTGMVRAVPKVAAKSRGARRKRVWFYLCLPGALLLLLLFQCERVVSPARDQAASAGGFGSPHWMRAALRGDLFFIPPGTGKLPDLDALKPVGVIYARVLDIPPRDFRTGFPGVTDRFEWFALRYTGQIDVSEPGTYVFQVVSDDGARVYIDGKQILDNDGLHSATARQSEVALAPGKHALRLEYFQGPRTMLALQLACAAQGTKLRPFPECDLKLETPGTYVWGWRWWTEGFATIFGWRWE